MPAPKNYRAESFRVKSGDHGPNLLIPISIIVVLLTVLGFGYWLAKSNATPTNPSTLCLEGKSPPSVNVVLIDITDRLSQGEKAQIISEIERIRSGLPRFSLIEIYTLGQNYFSIEEPNISICNPGRGADMNSIYQNPELVEKKWRLEFVDKLNQVLLTLFSEDSSNQSLILEAIKTISLVNYGQAKYDSSIKNLYIFSDFLQNAPGSYSHYSQPLQEYEIFKNSPYAAQIRTNLSGVTTSLFYIRRPRTNRLQNGTHQQFWLLYFTDNGAVIETVKSIYGD